MKIYTGIIEEISERDPYNTGHKKRLVKVREDAKQSVWIEFKGPQLTVLEREFDVNDSVSVATENVSSKSRNQTRFNNIYAKGIDRVNLSQSAY